MKKPFDRIVGPEGVWTDDDARPCGKLNAREEFTLRCLNAAANLYGVVMMDDFVNLYNRYAKNHEAPISDKMTMEELDGMLDRLQHLPESDEASVEAILERPEVWFSTWLMGNDASLPRIIVAQTLTSWDDEMDGTPRTPEEQKAHDDEIDQEITHRINGLVAAAANVSAAQLSEEEFLDYEEPMFGEDFDATVKLSEFIQREYGLDEDAADFDIWGIQSHIRCNGAKVTDVLEYIRDNCEWRPMSFKAFDRLVRMLIPVVDGTRTWEGRGYSQDELHRLGVVSKCEKEDVYDVFGIGETERDAALDGDLDGSDDCDEDGYIHPENIPLSHYEGPIDFKFVKDTEKRDAKLAVYEDVRQVTCDYVRTHVIGKMAKKAHHAAAVRLGFLKKSEKLEKLDSTLDSVVGDFASMMDDQDGEPFVKCALKKKGELDAIDARAASYYENYRYTWLEILAVKAGLGVKCRDLLTGEELFMMETSLSKGDVKGMTICVGIAPMVDVYIALGVIAPAHFENPSEILKVVLSGLGLPTELPIRLSLADQAKFAAETIRRIHALGWFDALALGMLDP